MAFPTRAEQTVTDTIVIGGGLAGLACAVALADRGQRVTVVECADRLGGRAGSWQAPGTGDIVDIGPHVFHSEYRNMLALLDRLGTSRLIRWQPDPVLSIACRPMLHLRHGRLPPPFSLMMSMAQAPGLSMADLMSMSRLSMHVLSFGEEEIDALDRISADAFLRREGVSERMIEWWWRFAAMVVTNVPLERCSAASMMRIHCQLSSYRGLHFGFARVSLAELYEQQATRLIEGANGRVLTGTRASTLLGEHRVEGVRLAEGTELRAPHVVCAVPPQALGPLLPDRWRACDAFDMTGAIEPSPYVSCYLWFDRKIKMPRFVSHLCTPNRLNYDYYDLTQIRQGWEGRNTVTASNIIYSHRAKGMHDEEIVAATVRELAQFAPQATRAKVVHADIHRIPMAIPCPVVGFERLRPRSRTHVGGLYLAGDWIRTHMPCSMESAAKSGYMAAEEVLADAGQPGRIALGARPYDGIGAVVRPLARPGMGMTAKP
jgi:squalene-associated FAD-dependent desaturase